VVVIVGIFGLRALVRTWGPAAGRAGRIALVEIEGPMYSGRRVVDQLSRFREDRSIKAVVLRLETPGGGVAVAQEIAREVERLKKAGTVVVASMGNVAASGGYYVASAADWIMAEAGTMTGSIGVIISLTDVEELLGKLGIRPHVIKSGRFKDVGSPARKMTEAERALLQELVDDVHQQFVEAVVRGRRKPIAQRLAKERHVEASTIQEQEVRQAVQRLADGRIFSGSKAKVYGLVDALGNIKDAIAYAAERAGIEGKPEVVRERKPFSLIGWLSGETFAHLVDQLMIRSSTVGPLRYQLPF